jgi:hypothetical protein
LTNHEQAEVDIAIQEKVSQNKITLAHTKEKVYQILIFSTLNISSSASKEISGSFQGALIQGSYTSEIKKNLHRERPSHQVM